MAERRRAPDCSCGAQGAEYGDPHREGCPRYRDRSKSRFVVEALRRRWDDSEGEWLFFEEVWRIDAFVVRCWQSGIGNRRIAFEVKTSRGDFLTELRSPGKRRNALDLSHQFFFATPKGLVEAREVPPECGLIEIDAKGRTRTVVKAPVREPRGLRMSEAIYLMRKPLYGGGVLQMRRELLAERSATEHNARRATEAQEALWAADELLARYAGQLVVVGSHWVGAWAPHSWVPALAKTEVYVETVEPIDYRDGSKEKRIVVRRLDGKDSWPWTFYSLGSFLRAFAPVGS